jgi:hypothetical protein
VYTFGVAVNRDFHFVIVGLYCFSAGDNFLGVKGRSLNNGLECLSSCLLIPFLNRCVDIEAGHGTSIILRCVDVEIVLRVHETKMNAILLHLELTSILALPNIIDYRAFEWRLLCIGGSRTLGAEDGRVHATD